MLAGDGSGRHVGIALRLLNAGYAPIPILVGEKRPAITGWSRWCTELPTEAQLEAWAREHPGCGWGIACGRVVALDIDADEPERATHLAGLAVEIIGPTPAARIGRAPRRLLVYRASAVIESRRVGDVEILAAGRQFVAVHIHPLTGKPYTWPLEHLADLPLNALPTISADQVEHFLDQAAGQGRARRAGQARHGGDAPDVTVDPVSGLVIDGREAWLARCVWRSYWEAIDGGVEPDLRSLGESAWARFCAIANLDRPHGRRPWRESDARERARSILAKARAGRLPARKNGSTLRIVRIVANRAVHRLPIADARLCLDEVIGRFFDKAIAER